MRRKIWATVAAPVPRPLSRLRCYSSRGHDPPRRWGFVSTRRTNPQAFRDLGHAGNPEQAILVVGAERAAPVEATMNTISQYVYSPRTKREEDIMAAKLFFLFALIMLSLIMGKVL